MNDHALDAGLEPVLRTSQLAAYLGVPMQTIHDLRCAGAGPDGFRVGRELRYRVSEVRSWLARLEADQLALLMGTACIVRFWPRTSTGRPT